MAGAPRVALALPELFMSATGVALLVRFGGGDGPPGLPPRCHRDAGGGRGIPSAIGDAPAASPIKHLLEIRFSARRKRLTEC